jgi:hypothetical protein
MTGISTSNVKGDGFDFQIDPVPVSRLAFPRRDIYLTKCLTTPSGLDGAVSLSVSPFFPFITMHQLNG